MNDLKLYYNLIKLCSDNQEFKYVDRNINKRVYRVFTYGIPRTKEFELDNALDCRGTMFDITEDEVKLVALPQQKFFNYPKNLDLKKEDIKYVFEKMDGSLITTWIDENNELQFKSKTMPHAHVNVYKAFMRLDKDIRTSIYNLTLSGICLDFEYVGNNNLHIVDYKQDRLVLLKGRSIKYPYNSVDLDSDHYADLTSILAPIYDENDLSKLVRCKDIEGFVVEVVGGQLYKLKTNWYYSIEKVVNIQDLTKFKQKVITTCLNSAVPQLIKIIKSRDRSVKYGADKIIKNVKLIESQVRYYTEIFDNICNEVHTMEDLPSVLTYLKNKDLMKYANTFVPIYKNIKVNNALENFLNNNIKLGTNEHVFNIKSAP